LLHYNRLGGVAMAATLITVMLMYFVNKMIQAKPKPQQVSAFVEVPVEV